jgi:hypothetical protein
MVIEAREATEVEQSEARSRKDTERSRRGGRSGEGSGRRAKALPAVE